MSFWSRCLLQSFEGQGLPRTNVIVNDLDKHIDKHICGLFKPQIKLMAFISITILKSMYVSMYYPHNSFVTVHSSRQRNIKHGFIRPKNTFQHLCRHLHHKWGSFLFERVLKSLTGQFQTASNSRTTSESSWSFLSTSQKYHSGQMWLSPLRSQTPHPAGCQSAGVETCMDRGWRTSYQHTQRTCRGFAGHSLCLASQETWRTRLFSLQPKPQRATGGFGSATLICGLITPWWILWVSV